MAVSEINILMDDVVSAGHVGQTVKRPGQPAQTSYAQRIIDDPSLHDDIHNTGVANRNPAGLELRALVAEDYRTQAGGLFSQGFWALFWHRFGNWRMSVKPKALRAPLSVAYKFGAKMTQWFGGIDLPYTVNIGRRVKLEHFGGMILVARAIGDDVTIRQNTTGHLGIARTDRLRDWPVIGDGADLGAGVCVLGQVASSSGAAPRWARMRWY
jgi:serine O-acetyltransferase